MTEPVTVAIDGFLCQQAACYSLLVHSPNPVIDSAADIRALRNGSQLSLFNSTETYIAGPIEFDLIFADGKWCY
jgi:hypothetical protein